jgi:hypothetical protein
MPGRRVLTIDQDSKSKDQDFYLNPERHPDRALFAESDSLSLLYACHHSRNEMLKTYKLAFSSILLHPCYFDSAKDIILPANMTVLKDICTYDAATTLPQYNVQHLAIDPDIEYIMPTNTNGVGEGDKIVQCHSELLKFGDMVNVFGTLTHLMVLDSRKKENRNLTWRHLAHSRYSFHGVWISAPVVPETCLVGSEGAYESSSGPSGLSGQRYMADMKRRLLNAGPSEEMEKVEDYYELYLYESDDDGEDDYIYFSW